MFVMFVSKRPWDPERCLVQYEKDGVIQTHEKTQRPHNTLSYSHSWTSQQKVGLTLSQPVADDHYTAGPSGGRGRGNPSRVRCFGFI